MLSQINSILINPEFNYENITRNLNLTKGAFLAEKIMIELVNKGIGRQDGHEILRNAAIKSRNENLSMKKVLLENELISSKFSEKELDEMLDPKNYIGKAKEQVENLTSMLRVCLLNSPRLKLISAIAAPVVPAVVDVEAALRAFLLCLSRLA